jgi:hypothetical protein
MTPTPKPAPQSQIPDGPQPPEGWDKNPVYVQVENKEKRMTIKFPNIDALAGWLADAINK